MREKEIIWILIAVIIGLIWWDIHRLNQVMQPVTSTTYVPSMDSHGLFDLFGLNLPTTDNTVTSKMQTPLSIQY